MVGVGEIGVAVVGVSGGCDSGWNMRGGCGRGWCQRGGCGRVWYG